MLHQVEAQKLAKSALHFLGNLRLARGFRTWQDYHSELLYKQNLIGRTLQTLVMHETARAFRSWEGWYESRVHAAHVLNTATRRLVYLEETRLWNRWVELAVSSKLENELSWQRATHWRMS